MKRIATILVTLGALVATACGGTMPDGTDEVGRQLAPLWMAEQDLPGCSGAALAAEGPATLMSHPFDEGLVIAVRNGAPSCIDTERNALRELHTWQPPARHMMATTVGTVEPPEDDPVPIKEEEEDQETDGTEQPPDGLDRVAIPNFNETVSDDPVPIKGGKTFKALDPTAENDPVSE